MLGGVVLVVFVCVLIGCALDLLNFVCCYLVFEF